MTKYGQHAKTAIIAILVGVIALGAGIAVAHNDGTEIRITAMRHESDGRIEFAVQERDGDGWGERVLPRARFFPASGREGRWLNSSPIRVGEGEESQVAGGSPTAVPASTPGATSTPTPTVIGYGEPCLTTTGCGLGYFGVPSNRLLRVGIDIAPGKWNSDYEGPGEDSCYAQRLSEAVLELDGTRRNSWSPPLDLTGSRPYLTWYDLFTEQPSGRYEWHHSVIERRSTDYVYGPQQFTLQVAPTDYAVLISSECL